MLPKSFLNLCPDHRPPVRISLTDEGSVRTIRQVSEEDIGTVPVFSELGYEFIFEHPQLQDVTKIRVYINDVYEPSIYEAGKITFPSDGGIRSIFTDCYGYVEIGLEVSLRDGREEFFRSNYLPVLVRKGQYNEAVRAMVQYVYDHQEELLFNGLPQPRVMSGLKEGGRRTLAARILLAEHLAEIYEESYGYFKANSRFHVEKTARLVRLEKLQYVTADTVANVVAHPEYLKPAYSSAGIRVGGRIYQPLKVLSVQNVRSYDIYENRVIVGFLRKMIDEIAGMKKQCESLLGSMPQNESYNDEYVYSPFFMFSETKKMLEDGLRRLLRLYEKYTRLWNMYHTALQIPYDPINCNPHPTAVFMSVPQYNRIYTRIHQWLNYGVYALENERFMFTFIRISYLYESYLLAKLLMYLKDRGYTNTASGQYVYPVLNSWGYKNTSCLNTFTFSRNSAVVTLYYQPVIFTYDRAGANGIGLYRNNTIPIFRGIESNQGGHYYAPDYLVRFDNGQGTKYVLLDAKFSDLGTIKKYYAQELAFKYLFSVSPVSGTEQVAGLGIIYAKCSEGEGAKSLYDKQMPGRDIVPFAEVLPMMEGISADRHYEQLDRLFSRV